MAYDVYLGAMLCPVAPSKIEMKIKGQNKTLSLINDTQINVLKSPGLTEVSFDILLPNSKYSFASYEMGFKKAEHFLNLLEAMKVERKPFWFKVVRFLPTNEITFLTEMKVSLEDYTIKDDVKEGFDITVSVKLKQYKDYGTKIVKIIEDSDGDTVASVENTRSADTAPTPKTYTVVKGDCLWNIAKKYLGDGRRYTEIYELNKDIITNPNRIYVGQVLKMPDGATAPKTTTTQKKTETPKKTTTTAKPKSVKINVSMSGAMGFTAMCYAEYVSGKVKKTGTFKANFNLNVDTDSNVSLTFRHTNGKMFKMSTVLSPVSIWKQEKGFTSVKLLCVANSDATVSVVWQ